MDKQNFKDHLFSAASGSGVALTLAAGAAAFLFGGIAILGISAGAAAAPLLATMGTLAFAATACTIVANAVTTKALSVPKKLRGWSLGLAAAVTLVAGAGFGVSHAPEHMTAQADAVTFNASGHQLSGKFEKAVVRPDAKQAETILSVTQAMTMRNG